MSRWLVGCEFSGRVREALRRNGHDAWSCDLLPAEDGSPYHIQGDVLGLLDDGWDGAIFHPTCTRLTNSGVRWLHVPPPGRTLVEMWRELFEAAAFYLKLRHAPIPRKAIENPVMHCHARELIGFPVKRQVVQPWWFGGVRVFVGDEAKQARPCPHGAYILDEEWNTVTCSKCSERVDAFAVLLNYAEWWQGFKRDWEAATEARKNLQADCIRALMDRRAITPEEREAAKRIVWDRRTKSLDELRDCRRSLEEKIRDRAPQRKPSKRRSGSAGHSGRRGRAIPGGRYMSVSPRRDSEQEHVERVMTMHWDLAACRCGLCEYGRSKGWKARERYLPGRAAPSHQEGDHAAS